jgi:ABC-type amino acid transport substrate-binding protein
MGKLSTLSIFALLLLQYLSAEVVLRGVAYGTQVPYIYVDKNGTTPDTQYFGFVVDVLNELLYRIGNTTYEIYDAPGATLGAQLPNGNWTGAVGELVAGRADFILGALPITSNLSVAIDFTRNFIDQGLIIMTLKPTFLGNYALFSFLNPYTWDVWLALILTTPVIGLIFYFTDAISPYGFNKSGGDKKNELDLRMALLNSMKIIGNKNFDNGKAWSTRFVILGWGLFALIIIAAYIANLAASLNARVQQNELATLEDILTYKFKYAVVANSLEARFMATNEFVKDIQNLRVEYPTFAAAVQAVRSKQVDCMIAFSHDLEFQVNQRPCDMQLVGQQFWTNGLGIALPKKSPYLAAFDKTILALREEGFIDAVFYTWWYEKGFCSNAADTSQLRVSRPMSMQNLGGVWVMLCVFLGIGLISLILENLYYFLYYHKKQKVPQLKYLHRFFGGKKEVPAVA